MFIMSARIQPLLRATGALRAATLGRRMVPALRPTVVPLLTRSFTSTPRHLSAGQCKRCIAHLQIAHLS